MKSRGHERPNGIRHQVFQCSDVIPTWHNVTLRDQRLSQVDKFIQWWGCRGRAGVRHDHHWAANFYIGMCSDCAQSTIRIIAWFLFNFSAKPEENSKPMFCFHNLHNNWRFGWVDSKLANGRRQQKADTVCSRSSADPSSEALDDPDSSWTCRRL